MRGYLRQDGKKGIRNVITVAYLVECAHHVARKIVTKVDDMDVHLIGFPGCYPNAYALKMRMALGTHSNVGGVLLDWDPRHLYRQVFDVISAESEAGSLFSDVTDTSLDGDHYG